MRLPAFLRWTPTFDGAAPAPSMVDLDEVLLMEVAAYRAHLSALLYELDKTDEPLPACVQATMAHAYEMFKRPWPPEGVS